MYDGGMTKSVLTTRRHRAGLYEVRNYGFWIEQAYNEDGTVQGWWLSMPTGEWMQTYATKNDALLDLEVYLDSL